jgi:hypothetical protein
MNVTAVLKNELADAASPDCAAAQPAASICRAAFANTWQTCSVVSAV